MPFGGPSEKYPYRCNSCGLENDVEDIIIDAFIASMEYKRGKMPKMECPCGGTLLYNPRDETCKAENEGIESPPEGR